MRRVLLLIAVVVLGSAAAIGATLPALGQSKTTTKAFSTSISSVVVRIDAGSLQIRPGAPTSVTSVEHWTVTEPTVTESVDNGVLTVQSKCSSASTLPVSIDVNPGCSVDFTLAVPSNVTVDAALAAGDIDVAGLNGSETLATSAGNITASEISGPSLTAHTDSGNVTIDKLRVLETNATTSGGNVSASRIVGRSLTAHSDSGDIDIEKVRALVIDGSTSGGNVTVGATRAPNSLRATSDSGDIQVTVPRGYYSIKAHTDSGSVTYHGLKNSPGASRSIEATTSSGNVTVNGA
ncbi:MAG: DUF4097 family beta strand repeat-containing protein [Actinomycetota bacterium]